MVSDQVSCQVDKIMVKDNDKIASIHASIHGSIGLQEQVDSSRSGARPVVEPILHAFLLQKRNVAVSQLKRPQPAKPSHLQFKTGQMRIAASGCKSPGVAWIGHHCVAAS